LITGRHGLSADSELAAIAHAGDQAALVRAFVAEASASAAASAQHEERLVAQLARREPDHAVAVRHQRRIAGTVVLERIAIAVEWPAVDFHHQLVVGPHSVDLETMELPVGQRHRKSSLANQREQPPLPPGAGVPRTALLFEDCTHSSDATAGQAALDRLLDLSLGHPACRQPRADQLLQLRGASVVDDGTRRRGNPNAVAAPYVTRVERAHPVPANARPVAGVVPDDGHLDVAAVWGQEFPKLRGRAVAEDSGWAASVNRGGHERDAARLLRRVQEVHAVVVAV
jgi:hypothetical protein